MSGFSIMLDWLKGIKIKSQEYGLCEAQLYSENVKTYVDMSYQEKQMLKTQDKFCAELPTDDVRPGVEITLTNLPDKKDINVLEYTEYEVDQIATALCVIREIENEFFVVCRGDFDMLTTPPSYKESETATALWFGDWESFKQKFYNACQRIPGAGLSPPPGGPKPLE